MSYKTLFTIFEVSSVLKKPVDEVMAMIFGGKLEAEWVDRQGRGVTANFTT